MAVKSNNHIYIGLGTLSLMLIGSVILIQRFRKKETPTYPKEIDTRIFDSPDIPGSGACINKELLLLLQALEIQTGYPVLNNINSAVRSYFWNKKVGGVSDSAHLITKCKAVDIKAPSIAIRNQLVIEAYRLGFKRIGVGNTFVHLDVDASKPQYVAWGYPSGTAPSINPFA